MTSTRSTRSAVQRASLPSGAVRSVSQAKRTSLDVSGAPSCQTRSGRSSNVATRRPSGRRGIVGHDGEPAVLDGGHADGEPRDELVVGVAADELLRHGGGDDARVRIVREHRRRLADEPDDDITPRRARGRAGLQDQEDADEEERDRRPRIARREGYGPAGERLRVADRSGRRRPGLGAPRARGVRGEIAGGHAVVREPRGDGTLERVPAVQHPSAGGHGIARDIGHRGDRSDGRDRSGEHERRDRRGNGQLRRGGSTGRGRRACGAPATTSAPRRGPAPAPTVAVRARSGAKASSSAASSGSRWSSGRGAGPKSLIGPAYASAVP